VRALVVVAVGCAASVPPPVLQEREERTPCDRAITIQVRNNPYPLACRTLPGVTYVREGEDGDCYVSLAELVTALHELDAIAARNPQASERAMFIAAHVEEHLGNYAEAAKRLESYAARYAGNLDAPTALNHAAEYRLVVGDHYAALADVAAFRRTYGRKRQILSMLRCFADPRS
jgi:tetratricopeptide (TPR) repeat protein